MSLFNKIKKFSREEDVTATNIEKEFLNIYTLLNQFFTEPKNWTPTMSALAPMTLSATSVERARYSRLGPYIKMSVRLSCTTATAASTSIYFTAPPGLKPSTTVNTGDGVRIGDGNPLGGTVAWNTALNLFEVKRYDAGNWGLGANRVIQIEDLLYEISK